MKRYKIVVAYDGTDFHGWALQPTVSSISQTLQDTFYDIFKENISLVGASRTDAGVHALGQIARFHANIDIDIGRIVHAWQSRLPGSIVIRSLDQVIDDFHPHHGLTNKTYYYHLFKTRPLPFLDRYGLYTARDFDVQQLQDALSLFTGTHDFSAFSTGTPIGDNPICTIHDIGLSYYQRFGVYRISITGNRFLRHMVRRMVGAALISAEKKNKVSVADVHNTLVARSVEHGLPCAPAKGLVLYTVRYK